MNFHKAFLGMMCGAILATAGGALPAAAQTVQLSENDLVGAVISYNIKKHESLFDVARKFDVGIVELRAANPGVNPWTPKAGTPILVSSLHILPHNPRQGIVVDLTSLRLYYFAGDKIMTFPVAAGREGWETPTAVTTITTKRKNPIWTPTANIRAENPDLPEYIPAGKDNPLGNYAMNLGVDSIMIHGTTSPASIGRHASHGCIRLYPEDIESLFNAVQKGTQVTLARYPFQIGWQGETIYLEVAPEIRTPAQLKKPAARLPANVYRTIEARVAPGTPIDWPAVEAAFHRADGIPVAIGTGKPAPEQREASAAPTVGHTAMGMN